MDNLMADAHFQAGDEHFCQGMRLKADNSDRRWLSLSEAYREFECAAAHFKVAGQPLEYANAVFLQADMRLKVASKGEWSSQDLDCIVSLLGEARDVAVEQKLGSLADQCQLRIGQAYYMLSLPSDSWAGMRAIQAFTAKLAVAETRGDWVKACDAHMRLSLVFRKFAPKENSEAFMAAADEHRTKAYDFDRLEHADFYESLLNIERLMWELGRSRQEMRDLTASLAELGIERRTKPIPEPD